MLIVGLTGNIAAGKSTVANMLVELGAHLIDYDVVARDVVAPQLPAWKKIVEFYGKGILNEDLTLNRQKLAQIVFNDAEKLQKLNSIIHPAAFDEGARMLQEIQREFPAAVIIKDVPLLIESGYYKTVDKVVVVASSRENQLNRLFKNGYTLEDAEARIAAQLPLKEKLKYADYVINNDGSVLEIRLQVEEIYGKLKNLVA